VIDGSTIVLDVGKTHAKLSLWDEQGRCVERWTRANEPRVGSAYGVLDVEGIDRWLIESLAACPRKADVRRIIPVAHGAAAALLREGRLFVDPMDYEEAVPEPERRAYSAQRDPFRCTGSPFLPGALNLGMQLHLVESLHGPLPADVTILPWPQYWAWRLGGVEAAELTSLGCHSDLWRPIEHRFTDLAVRRGWGERMAPLRRADETLSTITRDAARATGLPSDCEILCGLHDSNAALLALRGHVEMANHDATVLSTGTWFVAMRSLSPDAAFDASTLPEFRDCLINVDVNGRAVPSARFMGGREAECIRGVDGEAAMENERGEVSLRRLPALLARGASASPSFVAGVGPYPDAVGRLENLTDDPDDSWTIASLYLAMMTDTALELIGSTDQLLVEGRFAEDSLLVRALAALRPEQSVYTCRAGDDLAYGALRLVAPDLNPPSDPGRAEPLGIDLVPFANDWRRHADAATGAARASIRNLSMSAER
jgi:sugar (pentulose or hexulose) kinase